MPTRPLHTSIRTASSLNATPEGTQVLVVITGRLTLAWRGEELLVQFEQQHVRTLVERRAANDEGPLRRVRAAR